MSEQPGHCKWCGKPLENNDRGVEKLYCNDAHRARFKRAEKAANLADIVQELGPFVTDDGIFIYKRLVDSLAGRLNDR